MTEEDIKFNLKSLLTRVNKGICDTKSKFQFYIFFKQFFIN